MQQVATGTLGSLSPLYERYKSPLLGFLVNRTHNDRATAEDLLHATFERIIRYRRSWNGKQSFRAWAFTIARNVHHDHVRKAGRMPLTDTGEVTELSDDPGAGNQDPVDCTAALAALPDNYRIVVELAWQREMKYADIARVLGTTESNVKVRMHRACKRLRANYHNSKSP
jgi:RNA polymerase sigma-70 factor (ECF subfamily)